MGLQGVELSILHGLELALTPAPSPAPPPPPVTALRTIFAAPRATLYHGDSSRLGEVLPENSVDALVTDPPAGVGFMGKEWDADKGGRDAWIQWLATTLAPAYRALKPGGHGLVWALPRTSHWTALALELAGFEIRDRVSHLFGTGFPKSLTSKSAEIPEGAGTALKPAVEDWWLVRKPLEGTVGDNFAKWGTGVIWIDACRIATEEDTRRNAAGGNNGLDGTATFRIRERHVEDQPLRDGRWPAHLVLDEEAASTLDEQSGMLTSGVKKGGKYSRDTGVHEGGQRADGTACYADSGGASRFFYVAKGSRSEKDAGLEHLPPRSGGEATGREDGSAGVSNPRAGAGRTGGARNFHPTVKSIALMRWLCRLITPPGGTVLDTFAGSGSTGVAAIAEGFNFIGCELTEEYLPILEGRVRHALAGPPS